MEISQKRAIIAAFIVALGGFIFGLDAALISGGIRSFTTEFALSDLQQSSIVAAPGFGVLFALVVTGVLCDKLGRKNTLILIAAAYVVSAIASVLAQNFTSLYAARFLGGMAFTSLSVASMYIGEISPPRLRGKLVSILQLTIVIGLSLAFFISYGINAASQSGADWVSKIGMDKSIWRWMLGAEIIPALIWLILLFFVPKSPRWLMANGNEQQAWQALGKLTGHNWNKETDVPQAVKVDYGMNALQGTELKLMAALRELFKTPLKIALLLGVLVAVTQPITGMNAIMFYSPIVFEQLGGGTETALAQTTIVGVISVIATLISLFFIDRLGRRRMFLGGLFFAAFFLLLSWYGFSQASYQLNPEHIASLAGSVDVAALKPMTGIVFDSDVAFKADLVKNLGFDAARANEGAILKQAVSINGMLIFISILGFIAAYQGTIGPVLWVLFSEIFPTRVRGIAIIICAFILSTVSYLVQQFFSVQLAEWGAANVFLFYGVCVVVCLILNFILLPETKNKTIEEIEASFVKA